jgi:hypothetical protein
MAYKGAMQVRLSTLPLFAAVVALGCASPRVGDEAAAFDQDFSSREAVALDFSLDGELVTDSTWSPRQKIQDQFLYTIGHLNADRSVGRLDRLVVSNIQTTQQPDGSYRITYHATMPVAWGRKTNIPATYAFTLPRIVSYAGLEAFTSKYQHACVDYSAHDVDSGSMWYYYRPRRGGCRVDPLDAVTLTATVTPSAENTSGKYPEYHRVWDDNALNVVAIFGKYEAGATQSDAGISAYNAFVASMRSTLRPFALTTEPAELPVAPGVAAPEATFHATLADGKTVNVSAILIDAVTSAPAAFYERYGVLSTNADVIAYNGHAGLGQNVRALANRGHFVAGKYLMLFMNGCDTFAYVDGSLAQRRSLLNPDDPTGTKYLDIVTNAMPSYFASNSRASTALVTGLMKFSQPLTYEQMFVGFDRAQVVLVTGEEDNEFTPGMPIGPRPVELYIRNESGSVAQAAEADYETPEVPAGTYEVTLAHPAELPGGDADLYVRVATAPTLQEYDCRPGVVGSNEVCSTTLPTPAKIFVKVVGNAAEPSAFVLAIKQLPALP